MLLPDPPLTDHQFQAVKAALWTWFRVRNESDENWKTYGHPQSKDDPAMLATRICTDIEHSGLLYRMLVDGKPPLPEPPPLEHAYPKYED